MAQKWQREQKKGERDVKYIQIEMEQDYNKYIVGVRNYRMNERHIQEMISIRDLTAQIKYNSPPFSRVQPSL